MKVYCIPNIQQNNLNIESKSVSGSEHSNTIFDPRETHSLLGLPSSEL